jgi:hypothetical protein
LLALCGIVFALGVVLFYVSARFRLPLTAFFAFFSGGVLTLTKDDLKRPAFFIGSSLALILTTLSLIPWAQANTQPTHAEDYLLLAQSSSELGWDDEAYNWALRAYAISPDREATLELLVTSFYNQLLEGLPQFPPRQEIENALLIAMRILPIYPEITYIAGVYFWLLGNEKGAIHFWTDCAHTEGPGSQNALSALLLTRNMGPREREYLKRIPAREKTLMLLLAESMQGDTKATLQLKERLSPEEIVLEKSRLQALFAQKNQ